jgi:uncharacterized protein (DUF697 family)
MELVPDSVKDAMARALSTKIQAALDSKRQRANVAVGVAAAAAAAVGATPIPIADAALIVPIQLTMLVTISAIWGLDISEASLATIISGAITSSAGTLGGRALVSSILKFIPGVGTVAGSIISGSTAAVITTTFGQTYIATLYALTKKYPDQMPTAEEIRTEFQSRLLKATAAVPKALDL